MTCSSARSRVKTVTRSSTPVTGETPDSSTENPIIADLMWTEERLIVELDGPEHRSADKFVADRRRDRLLQIAGFAVLRFTNQEIDSDIGAAASQIERFLTLRRSASTP